MDPKVFMVAVAALDQYSDDEILKLFPKVEITRADIDAVVNSLDFRRPDVVHAIARVVAAGGALAFNRRP